VVRDQVSSAALFAAWAVHAFTASGAILALLALIAVSDGDFRLAFFWLGLQVVVDAVDGALARLARVKELIPWFDGAKLDDIIDYLAYVVVPALMVWRGELVPGAWAIPVAAAMLLSSAYGFNRADAKTADHFFTGFPSYWNIVVFYLFVLQWAPLVNGMILVLFAVLVFVPIRYVYPSRTPVWQVLTLVFGVGWGITLAVMLWQYPAVSYPVLVSSFAYPLYYTVLSLYLHRQEGSSGA
jgi:phosphatidylcholine synthase